MPPATNENPLPGPLDGAGPPGATDVGPCCYFESPPVAAPTNPNPNDAWLYGYCVDPCFYDGIPEPVLLRESEPGLRVRGKHKRIYNSKGDLFLLQAIQ